MGYHRLGPRLSLKNLKKIGGAQQKIRHDATRLNCKRDYLTGTTYLYPQFGQVVFLFVAIHNK